MIKTNTNTCSLKELADIALSNNLYVSSTWLLKRTLEKISNGDRSESKARLWIAYRASKPVGVAVLSGKDSSLMFYVKAEHRRQGIASKLLIEVELDNTVNEFCVSQGNKASIQFFKRLGLTPSIEDAKRTVNSVISKWKSRSFLKQYKQNNYAISRGMDGVYSV